MNEIDLEVRLHILDEEVNRSICGLERPSWWINCDDFDISDCCSICHENQRICSNHLQSRDIDDICIECSEELYWISGVELFKMPTNLT